MKEIKEWIYYMYQFQSFLLFLIGMLLITGQLGFISEITIENMERPGNNDCNYELTTYLENKSIGSVERVAGCDDSVYLMNEVFIPVGNHTIYQVLEKTKAENWTLHK